MIYTVTFNPSLDYIISVPGFEMGKTNRTSYEQMLAGGKGINVTTVLSNLGVDSTALGFTAGFTGDELIRKMKTMGLKNDFIRIENGFSRINVKLRDYDGTEINGMGPVIDGEGLDALMDKGIQIPGKVKVCGFDDLYMAQLAGRKLTTIHQDSQLVAKTTIRLLTQMIAGQEPPEKEITIPVSLIRRATT